VPPSLARIRARLERAHPFVAVLIAVELCRRGPPRFEGQCARLALAAYSATAAECPPLELAARAWLAALEPWALAAAQRARARLAADPFAPGVEHDVFEAAAALGALTTALSDADTGAGYLRLVAAQKELLELSAAFLDGWALRRGEPAGLAA
jgi:hypothetical protein